MDQQRIAFEDKLIALIDRVVLSTEAIYESKDVELIEQALRLFPEDPEILCMVADLCTCLGGIGDLMTFSGYSLEDLCHKAIQVNPECAEAWDTLGDFKDTFRNDFVEAERCFRKALKIDDRVDSYVGLARVLAQTDRSKEAIELLDKATKLLGHDDLIKEMSGEISRGEWS